jgi:hypothetical protein
MPLHQPDQQRDTSGLGEGYIAAHAIAPYRRDPDYWKQRLTESLQLVCASRR